METDEMAEKHAQLSDGEVFSQNTSNIGNIQDAALLPLSFETACIVKTGSVYAKCDRHARFHSAANLFADFDSSLQVAQAHLFAPPSSRQLLTVNGIPVYLEVTRPAIVESERPKHLGRDLRRRYLDGAVDLMGDINRCAG